MYFNEMVQNGEYYKVRCFRDRLYDIKERSDWGSFIPMVNLVFNDNDEIGGRPYTNEIVVIRAKILQSLYELSHPELEFQYNDWLNLRNILGYPDKVPDLITIREDS